jgi:hypothetical protein
MAGNGPLAPGTSPSLQPAAPNVIPGSDTVHFSARIGSFKVLGSPKVPVQGTMDIKFNGTVLVTGLDKAVPVQTSGTIRMEKETPDHLRQCYFGKGELVIRNAKMRSLQFLGKDMEGTFKGYGIFRLFGEFDKKLETGFIWYDGEERHPWGTSGNQVVVPNPAATAPGAKVRVHPAG